MTPQAHVERVLAGEAVDRVPFTMYEVKVHPCEAERRLRNRGMCIVNRVDAVRSVRPNVTVREEVTINQGKRLVRTIYETPVGSVSTLQEPAGFTTWHHERMFKSPDDYKVLRFLIEDEQFLPNYAAVAKAMAAYGGDGVFRANMGSEPLQALISGIYMGMERFCMEWMDNRDEIMALYELIVGKRREIYPLVAASPVPTANYGGNVTVEIIGLKTFEDLYLPHYNEAAQVMHQHGKLLGCHFDANCKLMAPAIARSGLDYIEAFTPAPDTDMTLGEARAAWPDKIIWMNFPSSLHLKPDNEVRAATVSLLNEVDSTDGLIMGITEDIPEHRWRDSCHAIMDGLEGAAGSARR